jgi:outer membrane usher protein
VPSRTTRALNGRRARYHILALGLLALAGAARAAPPAGFAEAVLEVAVNARSGGEMLVVLRDAAGHLYLEAGDYARLNLTVPTRDGREVDGKQYFPLFASPRLAVEFDAATQHVNIKAPPEAFSMTRLAAAPVRSTALSHAEPGAFLNYQLSEQRISGAAATGAFAELGVFGGPGVLLNSAVARDAGGSSNAVRLDTTFSHDFATRLETLNVGDSISDPGSWGNAVRFGGLRWGRNFGIRPDLLTTPLLTTGGTAVVPSTVDVFINSQRVSSLNVPPGPFTIDNVPAVSGAGDVRVVVRDALGREQSLTQSFYSGVSLLAPGLSQYSVDVGPERENYALESFHYGAMFGAGTYRRGLSDSLTVEGHGEFAAGDARALGVNFAKRIDIVGILTATLAGGGNANRNGLLAGIGWEHRERRTSLVFNTSYATSGFRQVADTSITGFVPKTRTVAQASIDFTGRGSFALAGVFASYWNAAGQQTVSAAYSVAVGDQASLNLTLSDTTGVNPSRSVYLTYTLGLGARRAFTATAVGGTGAGAPQNELYATLLENPPVGPGYGWRVGGASSGNYDVDGRAQWRALAVEAEAARNQGITGQSLFASGAATLLDGTVHATRSVNGSFGVVDVGGIPGIPVYLDNQLVTRTDASGRALLYNLRPYEDNRIGIAPEELPLDTEITSRRIVLAPPYRSGVVARFPVSRIHGATFRLLLEAGKPVPAGATVHFNGGEFPVAFDGVTYVTTAAAAGTGHVTWDGEACDFESPAPPAGEVQPDLGTLTCRNAPP